MEKAAHEPPRADAHGDACGHCLVDPKRNKSSKVAWIVASVAVALALLVFFSKAGGLGSAVGGYGSAVLLGTLVCPLTMGAMMFFMMRGKNKKPEGGMDQ